MNWRISLSIFMSIAALGANLAPLRADDEMTEEKQREFDTVALSAKLQATQAMIELRKRNLPPKQDSKLLVRIIENLDSTAEIEFRVAHGKAGKSGKAADLRSYHKYLNQSIQYLNEYLSRYSSDQDAGRMFYLRARDNRELGNKQQAIQDLQIAIQKYPTNSETLGFHYLLSDLLLEAQDFRGALEHLVHLSKFPSTKYYPYALNRLSMVHYQLKDYPAAMKYLESEMRYQKKQGTGSKGLELEKGMQNAALFYASAMEAKLPGYNATGAVQFFRRLAAGESLGKSIIQFAYLLRAKAFDDELDLLRKAAQETRLVETDRADLLMVVFENQLNRKQYAQMRQTLAEYRGVFKKAVKVEENDARALNAKRTLGSAAETLQGFLVQNKGRPEAAQISAALTDVYGFMIQAWEGDIPTQAKLRYNLAEAQFAAKDYDGAAKHYRWIIESVSSKDLKGDLAKLRDQAELKLMASRFESLQAKQLFAKNLTAQAYDPKKRAPLPELAQEWIKWVDTARETEALKPVLDFYRFEAARLLYARGDMTDALRRLDAFALKYPSSKFALPAASLVVDTFVASQDWKRTHDLARKYSAVPQWAKTPQAQKLAELASSAYYKGVEKLYSDKKYSEAIAMAEAYLKLYPTGQSRMDAYSLVANAYLALGDKKHALSYLAQASQNPKSKTELAAVTLLTQASVAEDDFEYETAVRTYRSYLAALPKGQMSEQELNSLRKKIILLAWLSGSANELSQTLSSAVVCVPALAGECERTRLLGQLTLPHPKLDAKSSRRFVAEAITGKEPLRAIYAALALEAADTIQYKDLFRIQGVIAVEWEKQDPIVRYTLLPFVSAAIPETLEIARQFVKTAAPLKLDKNKIAGRVKLMEELETQAAVVAKLPWARIRAATLHEIAGLYNDFSQELAAIPAPSGLDASGLAAFKGSIDEIRLPFERKRDEFRAKAFEVATSSDVNESLTLSIAKAIATENTEYAGVLTQNRSVASVSRGLDFSLLSRSLSQEEATNAKALLQSLNESIQKRNWPKIAFLIQEGSRRKILSDGSTSVARAISLSLAGAQAEAVADLETGLPNMPPLPRAAVLAELVAASYASLAKEKTKKFIESLAEIEAAEVKSGVVNSTNAQVITGAAKWSKADVKEDFLNLLSTLAPPASQAMAKPSAPKQPSRAPAQGKKK